MARVASGSVRFVVNSRVWFPASAVNPTALRKAYSWRLYNESKCRPCENRPERFNSMCAVCQWYVREVKLYTEKVIDGKLWYGVPKNSWWQLKKLLLLPENKIKFVDRQTRVPFDFPDLKLTRPLYTGLAIGDFQTVNQEAVVDEIVKRKMGLILSPPRSGKTTMEIASLLRIKQRTLVICPRDYLAGSFLREFYDITNASEIEAELGFKLAGRVSSMDDTEGWPVLTVTSWQMLQNFGYDRVKKHISGKFGRVVVDEAHGSGAKVLGEIIQGIDAAIITGMTATDIRKDGQERQVYLCLGKPFMSVEADGLTPTVRAVYTKDEIGSIRDGAYTGLVKRLTQHKGRTSLIMDLIIQILHKRPDACLLITTARKDHIWTMVNGLNAKFKKLAASGVFDFIPAAAGVTGEDTLKKKEATFGAAAKGEVSVLCCTPEMVTLGLTIARLSDIVIAIPINSKAVAGGKPDPKYYQLTKRVCSPDWNNPKKQANIWHIVDRNGFSEACFVNCVNRSAKVLGYKLHKSVVSLMEDIGDDRKEGTKRRWSRGSGRS